MNTIQARIQRVVADHLGITPAQASPDKKFVADLGCDSLDTVELVMTIEDEFQIEISDADGAKLSTVQDAITYVTGRLGATV